MREFTKEQRLFHKMVEEYPRTGVWTGSYVHGLFDAYVLMTGEDPDVVSEQLQEAVNDYRQLKHEEYLDSLGVE